jgi:hypothetical protein
MVALTAGEMKGRLVPNWRKLENMLTHFPKAVPEIPVSNVEKAAEYYVNMLGFHFDWGNYQGGRDRGHLAGGVPYVPDECTIPPTLR